METPNRSSTLSVVGLGKLGAPLVACLASRGFRVIGVDLDPTKVEVVGRGEAPVLERGLAELLQAHNAHITATQDTEAAVQDSMATFVVLPTPSEPSGGFSLHHVLEACDAIGRGLRVKRDRHVVVISSTVMPGSTDGPVRSTLEAASGKSCGRDFGLCYCPEFVALGSVIRDLLMPDFVLIGESDVRSGQILEALFKEVCDNNPPVLRTSVINAELIKLALNAYVTSKITFANMLARICERVPGADVDVVTSALGLDSRIGRKYFKGAIGYGGPCFPRDNRALASFARRVGAQAMLGEATDRANREEVVRLAALVRNKLPPKGVVGILGVAYKPHTNVVEESQGLLLAQVLSSEEIAVVLYDPAAMPKARQVLGGQVRFAGSATECIAQADVVVAVTPWEEFQNLDPNLLARRPNPRTVIDCWRLFYPMTPTDGVDYLPLGIGPASPHDPRR